MLNLQNELKFIEEEIFKTTRSMNKQLESKNYSAVKTATDLLHHLINSILRNSRNDEENDKEEFFIKLSNEMSLIIDKVKQEMKQVSNDDLRGYRELGIIYTKTLDKLRDVDDVSKRLFYSNCNWYDSADVNNSVTYLLRIGVHRKSGKVKIGHLNKFEDMSIQEVSREIGKTVVLGKSKLIINPLGMGIGLLDYLSEKDTLKGKIFTTDKLKESAIEAYLKIKRDYEDNDSIRNNISLDCFKLEILSTRPKLTKNNKYKDCPEEFAKLECLMNFYNVYYK